MTEKNSDSTQFIRNWLLDELKERYKTMADLINEFNEGKITERVMRHK